MNNLGAFLHGDDDPWQTFGTEELCTWHDRAEPGISMVQTRNPKFARKLSQRSDSGIVREQWTGDYLRIFSIRMQPWQGRRLVVRYLHNADETPFVEPTNEAFDAPIDPPRPRKARGRVTTAAGRPQQDYGASSAPNPHSTPTAFKQVKSAQSN